MVEVEKANHSVCKYVNAGLMTITACTFLIVNVAGQPLPSMRLEPGEKYLYLPRVSGEPVEISLAQTGNKGIAFNVPFKPDTPDNEWLKGLAFNVKNTSNKTIVFVSLYLMFGHFGQDYAPAAYSFRRGAFKVPGEKSFVGTPLELKPGDSLKFEISDEVYSNIHKLLSSGGMPQDPSFLTLMVGRVSFADTGETRNWTHEIMNIQEPKIPWTWWRNHQEEKPKR